MMWLISSSEDCTLKLWDVTTGAFQSSLVGHQNFVNDVAISSHGHQIASGVADKKIRLWESSSGRSLSNAEMQGQSGDRGPVWKAAYSPDGRTIITVSDHTLRQWDSSTGRPGSFSFNFPASFWMESADFSSDRSQVVSCGESEGSIQLWDIHTGVAGCHLEGHSSRIVELAYSLADDLHDTKQQCHVILGTGDEIYESVGDLMFTRTEPSQLVIGSSNSIVRLLDPRSGEMIMFTKLTMAKIQQLASSPEGRQLALGTDFSIHLWDLQWEKPSVELKGHTSHVYCIAYFPCGQWIISSSDDRRARLWHQKLVEEETWSCVSVVRGFFGTVQNIVWNPVIPMQFQTGSLDGSVRV
ncbi:wD repeat domain [Linnemannia schmuckeri]|uniref:WD repeat domain n=1 Tax=Linnemannia schmuckeri TaxID=64567 RepID=A0A9P5RZC8_9FUNG|nr:wD repeat domain [Linnemannia schmuckeri]